MRKDRGANENLSGERFEPESLRRHFDRPEVAAVYLFGSMATPSPHGLSDIDLAYLGTDGAAEERVFDDLYDALQREQGEGAFDLVPLRRAPLHLQFAIATEGRPVFVRDPILAEAFGARAIARYLDFKDCRDRYFARVA
jgi:predicted nucleotidyltransferase